MQLSQAFIDKYEMILIYINKGFQFKHDKDGNLIASPPVKLTEAFCSNFSHGGSHEEHTHS
jgi:hypothetical protein